MFRTTFSVTASHSEVSDYIQLEGICCLQQHRRLQDHEHDGVFKFMVTGAVSNFGRTQEKLATWTRNDTIDTGNSAIKRLSLSNSIKPSCIVSFPMTVNTGSWRQERSETCDFTGSRRRWRERPLSRIQLNGVTKGETGKSRGHPKAGLFGPSENERELGRGTGGICRQAPRWR